MKRITLAAMGILPFLAAACSTLNDTAPAELATANLINAQGQQVGSVRLVDYGDSRAMRLSVTSIAPGTHGFHLHTTGQCTAPDFQSAGGHLNPQNYQHGQLNPQGKHLGDLPNIDIPSNGTLTTEIAIDGSRDYLITELFDADGTAVMIHSGADDYRTDPAGDAGSRIACGILGRS